MSVPPAAVRSVAVLVLFFGAMRAQTVPPAAPPPRPPLKEGADTNDATAYYSLGAATMTSSAATAGNAFYWAIRLDPTIAAAYDARAFALVQMWRDSLIISRDDPAHGYDRNLPRELAVQYQSLEYDALIRDPFFDRRFDLLLYPPSIRPLIARSTDPILQGYYLTVMHDFPQAAAAWERAIQRNPKGRWLQLRRANALYFAQQFDSAYAEFTLVLDTTEARQQRKLDQEHALDSKAVLLYAMGLIRVRQERFDAARELFGRSLVEDLGFYMSHVRLAEMDLRAADTVAAVNELMTAAQVESADPVVRLQLAGLLLATHAEQDAMTQVLAAIALDPHYAASYELLGRIFDARGESDSARQGYREFLRRAARSDPLVPPVIARITQLQFDSAHAGPSHPPG